LRLSEPEPGILGPERFDRPPANATAALNPDFPGEKGLQNTYIKILNMRIVNGH
jgi:hypothetical protein